MIEKESRIAEIRKRLPLYEDEQRLRHTFGVYDECVWMAQTFGLPEEEAVTLCTAALMHDITKSKTDE